jgi:2-polyprenyl-3-methyl-5-hydroxy-6-metoxy-1,4-benzoquinol methylase
LTRALAQAGYHAMRIDISTTEIEHAREVAGEAVRFEPGDLRALPDVGRFDAVVSWGNSFGYRPEES